MKLIALCLLAVSQHALIRSGLPGRTICLTFHDIVPVRDARSLWFDCSKFEFRSEIDWLLARGAHFITLDVLYKHLTQGTVLPSHPVCLTFADNYKGFLTNGYPILRAKRIPCAMFVHTQYVGSPIGRPKMNWNQLIRLDSEGLVSVESQTVTHPADLSTLAQANLEWEISDSKRVLEAHLHHPIYDLAYPNGKFDDRCQRAAEGAGYRMGFSEELTPAEKSPSIYAVARYVHTRFKRAWKDVNR